jgi:hypothetical protein
VETPVDATAARDLFDRGVKLTEQARWDEAEAAFARSAEAAPNANCLLNLAVARFQLRRPLGGIAALDRLASLDDASPEQRERALAIRDRLEIQVSVVSLTLSPATAEVQIDGAPLRGASSLRSVRLDPGDHLIAASAVGFVTLTRIAKTEPGGTTPLAITLAPIAASPPAADRAASLDLGAPKGATREGSTSVWKSPWLWGGVGVVVVGATIAIVAAASTGSTRAPSGGSEHTVVAP